MQPVRPIDSKSMADLVLGSSRGGGFRQSWEGKVGKGKLCGYHFPLSLEAELAHRGICPSGLKKGKWK